jgi:hypothetical protein
MGQSRPSPTSTGLTLYSVGCSEGNVRSTMLLDILPAVKRRGFLWSPRWGLNLATRSIKQLTFGTVDFDPDCTLEGKSLLFVAYKGSSTWQIAESPIEGGSPKELVRGRLWSPSVSPDGKFLTYLKLDGQGANPTLKFVVQNLADSSSREILAPKGTLSVKWTPDGHSLTYLRHDILADALESAFRWVFSTRVEGACALDGLRLKLYQRPNWRC